MHSNEHINKRKRHPSPPPALQPCTPKVSPEDVFEVHVVDGDEVGAVAEGGAEGEENHRLRQTPRDAVLHRLRYAASARTEATLA